MRILFCILFVTLFASSGAHSQAAPEFTNVITTEYVSNFPALFPQAMRAFQKIIPKRFKSVAWIYRLDGGTEGPLYKTKLGNNDYFGGFICKPHDCHDNQMVFLATRDGSRTIAKVVEQKLTGGEFQTFGSPTIEEINALNELAALDKAR